MSKFRFIILSILITLIVMPTFSRAASKPTSDDKIKYFNEVVLGSEFGQTDKTIKKWVGDINIFVIGNTPDHLSTELNRVIHEVNTLISDVEVTLVNSVDQANYIIYFGNAQGYVQIEPSAKPRVGNNWGLFWVYWNSKNEIFRGSMYVDIERAKSPDVQKHLLREELTQSLGIMNDSYEYPSSIFYQRWTETTVYSSLDRYVISTLYHNAIKTGMTKEQTNKVLLKL